MFQVKLKFDPTSGIQRPDPNAPVEESDDEYGEEEEVSFEGSDSDEIGEEGGRTGGECGGEGGREAGKPSLGRNGRRTLSTV